MLEILSKKFESPAHEAQERLRFLTRKVDGGLKAKLRAARIALGLPDLTDSKAKSYWYASVNDVPSHHMDRLRSLTGAANDNASSRAGAWNPCSAEAVTWGRAA
jgi:hypothetical protein